MKNNILKIIVIVGIIAFVLLLFSQKAKGFYFDNALIKAWTERADLQKAFPGEPIGNKKLEEWASKYGWKENANLFNYYPDKEVVEKIAENKYEKRIAELERKVEALSLIANQLLASNNQNIIVPVVSSQEGNWRNCKLDNMGLVYCDILSSDLVSGSSYTGIKILTK